MSWARWRRRASSAAELAVVLMATALTALWASLPAPDALATRNPRTTAFIELRRQQASAEHRALTIQWQWRRLDQISPYLRAAVVYAEDGRFYEHDGVDWDAIEQAAEKNYQRGAFSVGGSTITQQLAKNLYLSPSRSLLRKVREILIAGRIEDELDKPRILEIYLNIVEWGDGIFGAEAAARHWFGRSARALTAEQCARLAVALPNPFTRSPRVHSAALQRKVAHILWQLRRDGLLSRAQLASAAAEAGLPPPPAQDPAPAAEPPPVSGTPPTDAAPAVDATAADPVGAPDRLVPAPVESPRPPNGSDGAEPPAGEAPPATAAPQ